MLIAFMICFACSFSGVNGLVSPFMKKSNARLIRSWLFDVMGIALSGGLHGSFVLARLKWLRNSRVASPSSMSS